MNITWVIAADNECSGIRQNSFCIPSARIIHEAWASESVGEGSFSFLGKESPLNGLTLAMVYLPTASTVEG